MNVTDDEPAHAAKTERLAADRAVSRDAVSVPSADAQCVNISVSKSAIAAGPKYGTRVDSES